MNTVSVLEQKQSCTQTTNVTPRSRRIYSAQEKADYLALFEESGMTPADFCREMMIHEATFSLWRRTAREEASHPPGAPAFAEVQLAVPKAEAMTMATLHLPSGATLDFNLASESAWSGLGALLKVLA